MDRHTLEKLEFDRVRHELAACANCALGRERALRISPSRRRDEVETWLAQLDAFGRWTARHGPPPFGSIRDVRDLVRRAVPPAKLEPHELAALAETLAGLDTLRRYFAGAEEFPAVANLAGRLGDFSAIAERIGRAIDARGQVRDEASPRLLRLRDEIQRLKDETREVFDRLLRHQNVVKYLQYPSATFHAERTVLPVKADHRGRIPGIVHRSSDSGQTVFVEPAEAVALNNTRISLLQDESEEIGRILWDLTHLVHLNQKELLRTLDAAALVDLWSAKGRLAARYEMCLPEICAEHRLNLRAARNPILLFQSHAADPKARPAVVPIDVRLGEDFDVLMVTGPNTGGKTATLKTVGLLALMAQAGLPIPAAPGSALPVFDEVWIDVGDEQSLQQSLSTFSAHLKRILDVLRRAKRMSLVLFDELGAGTDPDEGAAMGRAIVEHLLASGALVIVTTHLGSLKALAYELKRVDNAAVRFDVESLQPTYELRLGEPGNSNAIAIASRLGMPKNLIDAARRHLKGQYRALNRAIGKTLNTRREAEQARRDAETARQEAARATLAAMDRAKSLEKAHEAYQAWVARILALQPGDPVFVKSFDKSGRVVRLRLEKQQATVDVGAMQVEVPLVDLSFDSARASA